MPALAAVQKVALTRLPVADTHFISHQGAFPALQAPPQSQQTPQSTGLPTSASSSNIAASLTNNKQQSQVKKLHQRSQTISGQADAPRKESSAGVNRRRDASAGRTTDNTTRVARRDQYYKENRKSGNFGSCEECEREKELRLQQESERDNYVRESSRCCESSTRANGCYHNHHSQQHNRHRHHSSHHSHGHHNHYQAQQRLDPLGMRLPLSANGNYRAIALRFPPC